MLPKAEFENILVRPISSDSLSSSFLIWIKDKVKAHRHITHTEQVFVLEGAGMMHLGDSTYRVSSGSFINIPKNTVHSVTVTSHLPMKVLSIQSPLFTGIDRHFIE
jgi:quercetin dioxygenase-like cupin family protein